MHILVTVHRVEGVKHKSGLSRRKPLKIYVKVACGDSGNSWKSKETSSLTPQWNESTFPLNVEDISQSLRFSLWRCVSFFPDSLFGMVSVKIEDLISQSVDMVEGIPLVLKTPKNAKHVTTTLTIWISVKKSDAKDNAEAALGLVQVAVDDSDIKRPGLETADHASAVLNSIASLSKSLGTVVGVIVDKMGDLAELHPYANIAWKACSSLYDVVKKQHLNDESLLSLVKTMDDTFSFADDLTELPDKIKRLESVITRVLQQIAECAFFIGAYVSRPFAGRILEQLSKDQASKIQEFTEAFEHLREDLNSGTLQHNTFVTCRISENVSRLLESEYIKSLKPSPMNLATRKTCLAGTRTRILDEITQWIIQPGNKNILWLHGAAGSGKSTIASTIAQYFYRQRRRGAYLFFERSTSDPTAFVRTLAHKLAEFDSNICTAISASIKAEPSIVEESSGDQFEKLITQPLQIASKRLTGPIVVVLDALDECGEESSRTGVLKLLAGELPKLPPVFRFLITSRRERDIDALIISQYRSIDQLELIVGADRVDPDIEAYIWSEMNEIRELNVGCGLGGAWPGQDIVRKLAEASEGLFIWVSTMSKFLREESSPMTQLGLLLNSNRSIQGLDPLYTAALETSCRWQQEQSVKHFRSVLTVIIFGHEPLWDHTIDRLLGLSEQNSCRFILARLRCLLDYSPGNPVRLLHASFRDYLTDENRGGGKPWSLSSFNPEHFLASCCFRIMSHQLHFNMCKTPSSYHDFNKYLDQQKVNDIVSFELYYASTYWPEHLSAIRVVNDNIVSMLGQFSRKQLLFWLEVLIMLDKLYLAPAACLATATFIKDYDPDLSTLWIDAGEFIDRFHPIFDHFIPHLYLSALPFAPVQSQITKIYSPLFPNTIQVDTEEPTSNYTDETGNISYVGFSLDGNMLISCFENGTIQIRSTDDYVILHEYDNLSHPDGIRVAKPGRDNDVVYCLTGQGALVAWESSSARFTSLHSDRIIAIEIFLSSSGECVVAGCKDGFIRIWSREDSKLETCPLEIRVTDTELRSIAIASNGLVAISELASGVKILDINLYPSPQLVTKSFRSEEASFHILAFSPDDKFLAVVNGFMGVSIWSMESEKAILLSLEDLIDLELYLSRPWGLYITSIDWLKSGHTLVVGFSHGEVSLFNVDDENDIVNALCGVDEKPIQVTASPDGTTFVTGSDQIWIWDSAVLRQTNDIWADDLQMGTGTHETSSMQFPSQWPMKSDWELRSYQEYGRIRDPQFETLFIIPQVQRAGLYWLGVKHIIGPRLTTRLDLSKFVHGERWIECYRGDRDLEGTRRIEEDG
ncbi:hypothetical protein QCA50_010984 [Cerrena zonata]|uniref:Uncharacterized protein n=1 Tax=Cerrena zonata TaxID=2478898 RepID=A0AAW0G3D3_9APHY